MKSFALWCDAKNAGESTGVKVLMNFNLWAEAEKGESHTVLDVGVMLIPEEKSSKRKQICEVVKSISFYCPFPLEKKNFENLFFFREERKRKRRRGKKEERRGGGEKI